MDEQQVCSFLLGLMAPNGSPFVAPDEVASVVIDADWCVVVLAKERVPRELLVQVHQRLTGAFPNRTFELRTADGQIYRGGAGFGAGRHVLAVLGGKGGVGK